MHSNLQHVSISYLESTPPAATGAEQKQKPPVLFLHGQAFTSTIWEETGTLKLVASLGHRAVAVDLPGFGRSAKLQSQGERETEGELAEFLAQLMQELRLERPVLVAPSMSGRYALPFLLNDAPTASQRVRALVAIAPAAASNYAPDKYGQLNVPVLYVYGARDDGLGERGAKLFGLVPVVELRQMEKAGHACYMEQPDRWRLLLQAFLQRL